MKHSIPILATCLFASLSTLTAGEVVLAAGQVSVYRIVLPDHGPNDAIDASLQQTARLFSTAFQANGFKLPVIRESEHETGEPAIFLGDTVFARKQGIDVASLNGWSYIHRVVDGRDLIIAGRDHPAPAESENSRRPSWDRIGTAKGVADFLRQFAGVRFLYPEIGTYRPLSKAADIDLLTTPAIEYLPTDRIVVPDDLDVQHTPAVRFNTAHPQGGSFFDIANNRFPRVDEYRGTHTWARAVPEETYHKTHPEYFALVNGKRLLEGRGQYCLSNPDVQELIYRDLCRWLDKGFVSVGVGQPDGFRACQCEDCAKLYETGDDWGEKIWIFNRKVAERLMKSHPGKEVTMMSYILTADPPKSFTRFPANTRIMLTGTNESDIEPWRGHEVPGGFTGYLYNWCPNLGTRYTPMRTPQFVEQQAKRIAQNQIRAFHRDGPGALYGLEGPVYYTMGRMYDDPENLFARDLVPEFVEAAFGESTWHMTRFYERLFHAILLYSDYFGTRCSAWTYHSLEGRRRKTVQDPFRMLAFLYPPSLLSDLENLISGAESKARSEKVKARLALVRREFDYLVHLSRVVHLHQAFELQPDYASRDRLLDAIDARNLEIASYYGERGRPMPVSGGWSHVMFPPPGHNAAHLRLAHNGYQEPYENTCFNWDTTAMRAAPLPGVKRLAVSQLDGELPITLDSPQWENAADQVLATLAAENPQAPSSKFCVLADDARIHVRIETAIAETAGEVQLLLAPMPAKKIAWRFRGGPDPESKQEAVAGLIDDAMDPRFGQFDPDWAGKWNYETRIDTETGVWRALFSIPFKTFSLSAPEPGSFWRANVVRITKDDVSAWSIAAGVRRPDDQNGFGEWEFGNETKEEETKKK